MLQIRKGNKGIDLTISPESQEHGEDLLTLAHMSGSHVRRKTFGRLSPDLERQGMASLEPGELKEEAIRDGSNTELGI
jgi:hypothetical protein